MDNNNNNDGASNSPACAACRHQRKKCKLGECVIWPHFPSDQMDDFQAVHRVFGIANVTKMMKELHHNHQRAAAANSLLWESKSWTEDPVHGPLGRFNRLQQELNHLKASILQFQPLPDPPSANNLNNRYSSSNNNSNAGFQYPNTNFGHQNWNWPAPIRLPYYNQTQPPIITDDDDLIRGDEYVETLFSDNQDNVTTNFSSSSNPPVKREGDDVEH